LTIQEQGISARRRGILLRGLKNTVPVALKLSFGSVYANLIFNQFKSRAKSKQKLINFFILYFQTVIEGGKKRGVDFFDEKFTVLQKCKLSNV
jgi:hypothetical protein